MDPRAEESLERKIGKQSHSIEISRTDELAAKRYFCKRFGLIISKSFQYEFSLAVFGKLVCKIPIVNGVLSSHELEIYITTSIDENCIEFEFQRDQNYYVDLRETYFALKLKLVKGGGHGAYKNKEVKKRTDKIQKRL